MPGVESGRIQPSELRSSFILWKENYRAGRDSPLPIIWNYVVTSAEPPREGSSLLPVLLTDTPPLLSSIARVVVLSVSPRPR